MEELARRLVVGHKADGRSVYDEAAKAELVAACGKPGASVSRLARECGVNANQLSRWVRDHRERRRCAVAVTNSQGSLVKRTAGRFRARQCSYLSVIGSPMNLTDIQAWIANAAQESQTLEFKRAASLSRTGNATAEMVKDVTAMANAEGGVIAYGITEESRGDLRIATGLDPITDIKINGEWFTQVVESNTGPSLHSFKVEEFQVDGGRVLVVEVAQGATANQSSFDHRYHQRVGRIVKAMLDFQVRDVMARRTAPTVEFKLRKRNHLFTAEKHEYRFSPHVKNIGGSTIERGYLEIDIPVGALPFSDPISPDSQKWRLGVANYGAQDYGRFSIDLRELHPEQTDPLDSYVDRSLIGVSIDHTSWRYLKDKPSAIHWRIYSFNALPIRGSITFSDWCNF